MNVVVKCVEDSHLEYIQDKTSAYEMIRSLENVLQRKTIGTKVYLKKKLMTLKCGEGRPVADFFKEFEQCVRAYKSAGGRLEEIEVVIDLLMAMPESLVQLLQRWKLLRKQILLWIESRVDFWKQMSRNLRKRRLSATYVANQGIRLINVPVQVRNDLLQTL